MLLGRLRNSGVMQMAEENDNFRTGAHSASSHSDLAERYASQAAATGQQLFAADPYHQAPGQRRQDRDQQQRRALAKFAPARADLRHPSAVRMTNCDNEKPQSEGHGRSGAEDPKSQDTHILLTPTRFPAPRQFGNFSSD